MLKELLGVKYKMQMIKKQIQEKQDSNAMDYAQMNKDEQAMQYFARRVNLQSEFFTMAKFSQTPKVEMAFANNPMIHYLQSCNANQSLIMPILNRIAQKQLCLLHYKLNGGICSALGDSFAANPKILTGICFDDNACTD